MLDGEVTDIVEAQSLSLNPQHIHIYSASWGPEDDGKSLDGPAKLAKEAFLQGITKVRAMKFCVFLICLLVPIYFSQYRLPSTLAFRAFFIFLLRRR